MGCDIHLHIEMKVKGKWLHYGCPHVDRDYDLFAMMANVRNRGHIIPISKPRGFPPDDISTITSICFENEKHDAHSISWLNKEEIDMLTVWYDNRNVAGLSKSFNDISENEWRCWNYHGIKTYLCGNNITSKVKGIDDVRLVFWFDN